MSLIADLVQQTSTSTGTGNFTLAASGGFQTFNSAFGNGSTPNVLYYFISDPANSAWEYGTGHMSNSTTLVRDTVIGSTNSNAAVNFSAGTKTVTNDLPAEYQVDTSSAQTLTNKTIGTSQLLGTATNDNAAAGYLGEYMASRVAIKTSTVTMTIASPAVITWTGHGFSNTAPYADVVPVVFTNSGGALPTGITAGTTYYVIPSTITTNTFEIATTVANALAGTAVNTSGSQSGTQTGTVGIALATGTTAPMTGLLLSAGDWEVYGQASFQFSGTTQVTTQKAAISTSATTLPGAGSDTAGMVEFEAVNGTPGAGSRIFAIPTTRIKLASPTNVYLLMESDFTVSTVTGFGYLAANRVR